MTHTAEPNLAVAVSPPASVVRVADANGVARATNGATAELIKQARATSRMADNEWLPDAMQQSLHGAVMALANHVAERGGGRLVSFAIFSDREDGEADLVADSIMGRRVMITVRRDDDRVQITKATVDHVERTGWMKKPYELSEVAAWLLRCDA